MKNKVFLLCLLSWIQTGYSDGGIDIQTTSIEVDQISKKIELELQSLSKAAQLKQQEVELLMAELDDSNKELEDSTRLLEQAAEKGQKLQEDKTKLANKIRELKAQVSAIQSQLLSKNAELETVLEEKSQLQEKLTKALEENMKLEEKNLAQAENLQNQADQITQFKKDLEDKKQELLAKDSKLAKAKDAWEKKIKEQEILLKEGKLSKEKYEQDIELRSKQLEDLKANQEKDQGVIKELSANISTLEVKVRKMEEALTSAWEKTKEAEQKIQEVLKDKEAQRASFAQKQEKDQASFKVQMQGLEEKYQAELNRQKAEILRKDSANKESQKEVTELTKRLEASLTKELDRQKQLFEQNFRIQQLERQGQLQAAGNALLKKELNDLTAQIKDKDQKNSELERKVNELKKNYHSVLTSLSGVIEGLKQKNLQDAAKIDAFKKAYDQSLVTIQSITTQADADKQALDQYIDRLSQEREAFRKESEKLQKELSKEVSNLASVAGESMERSSKIYDLEQEMRGLHSALGDERGKVLEKNVKIGALEKNVANAGGELMERGAQVYDEKKANNQLQTELGSEGGEVLERNVEIENLKKELADCRAQRSDLDIKTTEVQRLQSQLAESEKKYKEGEQRFIDLTRNYGILQAEKKELLSSLGQKTQNNHNPFAVWPKDADLLKPRLESFVNQDVPVSRNAHDITQALGNGFQNFFAQQPSVLQGHSAVQPESPQNRDGMKNEVQSGKAGNQANYPGKPKTFPSTSPQNNAQEGVEEIRNRAYGSAKNERFKNRAEIFNKNRALIQSQPIQGEGAFAVASESREMRGEDAA